MSSRCKGCNSILTEEELKLIDPMSGSYTTLCMYCLNKSEDETDTMPEMCEY
jgi:hypothetical protein